MEMDHVRNEDLAYALEVSERRRKEGQRLSGVGFWELNHQLETLYWSEEIFAIYDLDSKLIKPNYDLFLSLIYDEDLERIHQAYQASVSNRTEYNVRYRIKAGSAVKWIEARSVTYYDEDGEPIRSIGTAQDISEIIEAQQLVENSVREKEALIQEIQYRVQEAEQANAVKSDFLAAMSHELRTPLNAILGYSQMLQMGVYGELGPKQKEMTESILDGGNHLLRLVDDVLDLARIESNQLRLNVETFEANEVVSECVKWIAEKCVERNIRIEDTFSDGQKHMVRSDEVRLAQVFSNLFSNAEKYNVDGGTISIKGEATVNGYLRLTVSDTGIGINPDARLRIFDLFDRGIDNPEVAGGGIGIGLAVSRNIIERLGGWIDYRSVVGAGSEFWISIPLADNEDVLIWTDDLRVGIDEIDKDHQQIFSLINRASRISFDDDQVGEIIEQMIVFTSHHFRREEVIMQVVSYPDFDDHCSSHHELEAQVETLANSWRNHPSVETRQELQHFLRDWWRSHILEQDIFIPRHAIGKEKAIREELVGHGLQLSPMSLR